MRVTIAIALLLAAQSAPPRDHTRTAAVSSGSGGVSGRVVDRASGRPLHRAIVTLAAAGTAERREALADEDGRYAFAGLAAGEYGVSAGPGELRRTHLHQAYGRPMPLENPWDVPRTGVRLAEAEQRNDVDLALTPALAIEGRVLDGLDEPMTEVPIRLIRIDGVNVATNDARSDDLGGYRLFGLRAGRYRVCAAPDGDAAAQPDGTRFVRTCHPSADDRSAADVVLTDSDVSGIDIRVQRHGTYRISGTVVDSSGAPTDAAHVSAIAMDRSSSGGYARAEGGRFVVRNLLPGRYMLRGSIGGPSDPSDPRPPARTLEMGWAMVEVPAGDVHDALIRAAPPQRIRGHVQFDGKRPPSRTASKITVVAGGGQFAARSIMDAPSVAPIDDKLTFELTNIYPLPLTVAVNGLPDGFAVKSILYRGRDIRSIPTVLADGSTSGSLQIVLTDAVARPKFRVVDREAHSGVRVALLPADRRLWAAGLHSPDLKPAADGAEQAGAILPGDYLIAALTIHDIGAIALDDSWLEQFAAIATRITVGAGETPTMELRLSLLPDVRR